MVAPSLDHLSANSVLEATPTDYDEVDQLMVGDDRESCLCAHPQGWVLVECGNGSVMWRVRRCRKCEGCKAARRAFHRLRIIKGAPTGIRCLFLTLTSLPGTEWVAMQKAWDSFMRAVRKAYGPCEYVRAKEEGSLAGMKHYHCVLAGPAYIPQAWISMRWKKRIGATVVWIEAARVGDGEDSLDSMSYELAKYCTKGEDWGGKKMVTYSKGWPKLEGCTQRIVDSQPTLYHALEFQDGCYIDSGQVVVVVWPSSGACTCIPTTASRWPPRGIT